LISLKAELLVATVTDALAQDQVEWGKHVVALDRLR